MFSSLCFSHCIPSYSAYVTSTNFSQIKALFVIHERDMLLRNHRFTYPICRCTLWYADVPPVPILTRRMSQRRHPPQPHKKTRKMALISVGFALLSQVLGMYIVETFRLSVNLFWMQLARQSVQVEYSPNARTNTRSPQAPFEWCVKRHCSSWSLMQGTRECLTIQDTQSIFALPINKAVLRPCCKMKGWLPLPLGKTYILSFLKSAFYAQRITQNPT
jgi:hypothetical protein